MIIVLEGFNSLPTQQFQALRDETARMNTQFQSLETTVKSLKKPKARVAKKKGVKKATKK